MPKMISAALIESLIHTEARRLFNQINNHGNRQQSRCGDQNVVAPTGYISKHIHSK
jgi:hypothetical protein